MRWRIAETGNHAERVAVEGDYLWFECVETGDRGRIHLDDFRAARDSGAWTIAPDPSLPTENAGRSIQAG